MSATNCPPLNWHTQLIDMKYRSTRDRQRSAARSTSQQLTDQLPLRFGGIVVVVVEYVVVDCVNAGWELVVSNGYVTVLENWDGHAALASTYGEGAPKVALLPRALRRQLAEACARRAAAARCCSARPTRAAARRAPHRRHRRAAGGGPRPVKLVARFRRHASAWLPAWPRRGSSPPVQSVVAPLGPRSREYQAESQGCE